MNSDQQEALPDTASAEFAAWFCQSVVAEHGRPRVCYHWTDHAFARFASFSHFGTQRAARARAQAKGHDLSSGRLIEVYLRICRPLDVIDDQADNTPVRLLDLAAQNGCIDRSTQAAVNSAISARSADWANVRDQRAFTRIKWEVGAGIVAQAMAQLGYDGFRYKNTVEGDVSFVPFHGNQIWWVDRHQPEP